jgi:hypothetical protein
MTVRTDDDKPKRHGAYCLLPLWDVVEGDAALPNWNGERDGQRQRQTEMERETERNIERKRERY